MKCPLSLHTEEGAPPQSHLPAVSAFPLVLAMANVAAVAAVFF